MDYSIPRNKDDKVKRNKLLNETFFIKEKKLSDERGNLKILLDERNLQNFSVKQVLQSYNLKKGTVRGLHYQSPTKQAKIIKVLKGKIYDVFVNIDQNSRDFGKYGYAYLSDTDDKSLFISNKYAHGFQSLSDNTTVLYFLDNNYSQKNSKTILYDDKTISIDWPLKVTSISTKDQKGKLFNK